MRSNRSIVIAAATALAVLLGAGIAEAQEPLRYLVVVGHNGHSGVDRSPLRYADDDAGRTYELLHEGAARATLLTTFDADSQELFPHLVADSMEPTRANLRAELAATYEAIEEARAAGHRTVLHVFFSGHGRVDDGAGRAAYLEMADGAWTREDMLSEIVRPQVADFTHLVVDSCNAFFLVHGRGWADDAESDPAYGASVDAILAGAAEVRNYPRVGLFLATTGAAEVHEWSRYQAGVFSHQFRSAIVGAADVDANGALTYDEIGAYIAAANAAVSTPNARLSVYASAPEQNRSTPFIAVDEIGGAARLVVSAGEASRISVVDERGASYAEVSTAGDRPVTVALVAGGREDVAYLVSRGSEEAWIEWSAESDVLAEQLEWRPAAQAERSPIDREFRASLFRVPFGQAFYDGFLAGRRESQTVTVETVAPSPLRWSIGATAGTGTPVSESLGWETRVGAEGRFGRHRTLFGLVEAEGGFSRGSGAFRHRRASLVGGFGLSTALRGPVRWDGELAVGMQWIGAVGYEPNEAPGTLRADRVGVRAVLATGPSFDLSPRTQLGVEMAGALNVTSAISTDRAGDQVVTDEGALLLTEEVSFQFVPSLTLRARPR